MNTNENTRTNAPDDIIVLGVASVDTHGDPGPGEPMGLATGGTGISED